MANVLKDQFMKDLRSIAIGVVLIFIVVSSWKNIRDISLIGLLILVSINPSDLPWWGWLLCACPTSFAFFIAKGFVDESGWKGMLAILIAGISLYSSIIMAAIGVVRFVKWAWIG